MNGCVRFVRRDGTLAGETDFLEPQLNVLAHAQAIELEIGSLCGGHGICGGDWIQISNPEQVLFVSPLTESEQGHLSPADIAQGFRLACQCYPQRSDFVLEIRLPE